jgi:hypothetical protein
MSVRRKRHAPTILLLQKLGGHFLLPDEDSNRPSANLQPSELKKSLRTKNESVAFRRCRQYVAAANTFRLAHSTTVAWLKRWPLPPKKIKLLLQRKNLL